MSNTAGQRLYVTATTSRPAQRLLGDRLVIIQLSETVRVEVGDDLTRTLLRTLGLSHETGRQREVPRSTGTGNPFQKSLRAAASMKRMFR
jgi:hypothetical protein